MYKRLTGKRKRGLKILQKSNEKEKSERCHRNKSKNQNTKERKERRRGQKTGKDVAEFSFMGDVDERVQGYFSKEIIAY